MEMRELYLISVALGQVILVVEIILLVNSPSLLGGTLSTFTLINYFLTFVIQFMIIFTFLTILRGRVSYLLPLLIVPVVGQVTEAVLVYLLSKERRILRTAVFVLLFLSSLLVSSLVPSPPQFLYNYPALRTFAEWLAISDTFNVALLLYLYHLFGLWRTLPGTSKTA